MSLASEYAKLRQKRNVDASSDAATAGSVSLPAAGAQSGNQTLGQIYGHLRKNRTPAASQVNSGMAETVTVEQLMKMDPDGFRKTTDYLSKTISEKEAELTRLEELITSATESRKNNQPPAASKYHAILRNTGTAMIQENVQKYQQIYKEYENLIGQYNGYINAYNQWKGGYRRMSAIENDMEQVTLQIQNASSDLLKELETQRDQMADVVTQYNGWVNGMGSGFVPGNIPYAPGSAEYNQEYARQEQAYSAKLQQDYQTYQALVGRIEELREKGNESSDKELKAKQKELQLKSDSLSREYAWTQLKEQSDWYKKYQGLSYSEIGEILMADPSVSYEERRWAMDYGDSVKTEADVDKQITHYSSLASEQASLQAEYDRLKKILQTYPTQSQESQDATARMAQIYSRLEELGDPQGEMDALELEKVYITKYRDAYKKADFSAKSKYQSTKKDGEWAFALYDAINGDADAEEYITKTSSGYIKVGDVYVAVGTAGARTPSELFNDISDIHQMTQDEVSLFNYLYRTEGQEAAQAYFENLRPDLLARQRGERETKAAAYAQAHPWLSSIGTILASPAKITSFAGQLADYIVDGSIDKNASYSRIVYESNAARQAVSEKIAKGDWGEVGSFLYNTGMSMGDFLLTTAISGGNSGIALAIMGTGAAADTTLDALDRGLDSNKAMLLGSVAGLAEALTEKISIDALLNKSGLGKSALGYILQNTIAEGSEEGVSGIINLFADIIISKDKSQWAQSIQAYKDTGDDEKTAFWKAVRDQAAQIGLDVLGGALSGSAMGSGSAAISAGGAAVTGKKLQKKGITSANGPELIAAGMTGDPNGRAYFLATQMQAKLDAGEKLTSFDLGRLFQANKAEGLAMELTPGLQAETEGETPHRSPAVTPSPQVEGLGEDRSFANAQNDTETESALRQPATIQEAIRLQIPGQDINNAAPEGGDVQLANLQVNATQEMMQQARRFSAVTGRKIILFTEAATETGINDGYHENGVLYINTESNNPFAVNVGHELTHSIEPTAEWDSLKRLVLDRINKTTGDLEQRRKKKQDLYARNGVKLTDPDKVDREIVASYVAQFLLNDEQSIENVVQQDHNLGQKIHDWLNNLLAKLGNKNAQEAVFLRKARDLYAAALKKTQAVEKAQAQRQNTLDAYGAGQLSEQATDRMLEDIDERASIEGTEISPEAELHRIGMGDTQFSISPIEGQADDYGIGVVLDTNLFDGVSPRHWGKILGDFVYNHLAGTELTVYDDAGNEETIHLAKTTDRVRKDGANNSHKVIDKLARYRGDNIKALATVHLSELLETSKQENTTDDHTHQWMDENGWEHRKTYIQDTKGNIYEATLNIARGKERNILYDINNVRLVDKTKSKRVAHGAVPSTGDGRGSHIKGNSSGEIIAEDDGVVKQHSFSETTVRKEDVISDLRAILQKGGDPAALRQYVARLEQNTGNAEQDAGFAEQNGGYTYRTAETAAQILEAARARDISVEEYLEQNWERYDVDGQWNAEARKALEQEEVGTRRQYSISMPVDDEGNNGYSNTNLELRGDPRNMPKGSAEWHAFNRSFANKTSDIKAGEEREIYITTADYIYLVTADGYMQGYANKKVAITESRNTLEEYFDGIDTSGEGLDHWAEVVRANQGRYDLYGSYAGDRGEEENFDQLSSGEQDGDTPGDPEGSEEDYNWVDQEYLPGMLVYDGNGHSYRVNEEGLLVPIDERQYSFSETETEMTENGAPETTESMENVNLQDSGADVDIRGTLPRKAQRYLKRAERALLNKLSQNLSVPWFARRNFLQPMVEEISNEYLRSGTVSQETVDRLFEKAYAEGVVVDTEFYDQYVELKKFLQKNPVMLSEHNRADIADYDDFKKRNRYALRIVNEGGLPVDSAYRELQEMAPELFPDDITHPADQLVRMADVSNSIRIAEKSLQDYYKHDPDFEAWAKNDFGASINDITSELRKVKRYVDARMAEDSAPAPETAEEAMEVYSKLKVARRVYEKALAKNLLTDSDNIQLGRLIRGEIELQHLDPETDNVSGITAVYEAKIEYADLLQQIAAYKRKLHADLRKKADEYLKTANEWNDKRVGLAYMRETMVRNIEDIVPDKKLAKAINAAYFEKVAVSEAASTRMKNRYRERVEELGLSRKVKKGDLVSEAHAVQLLGEAMDNIRVIEKSRGRIKERDGKKLSEWKAVVQSLWAENPSLDKNKIEDAVQAFRKIYDELFREMNKVRVQYGYEPINYRSGYFPHFQPGDGDGILAQFGKAMGIDTRVDALPTTINGLTHTFKPGITWFGNAQERLGFNTAFDAVEGFDKYIEGVASVIHQTGNIQNLRALASQVRYRTSEPGIQEQVDEIRADDRLTEDEKQASIAAIYEKGKFTLSNFVTELDEYTNLLANKRSRLDRTIEALFGRRFYTFMKNLESRVGANMVGGNLASAITNFIPLVQANAQMDRFALLNGMWETLKAYKTGDGLVDMSDFLTNRRGSDPLIRTWLQSASNVFGKPMEFIDCFAADSIVRGAYYQNLKRGMTPEDAMHQADLFAARVMADRSKGAMPTLFSSMNPIFKAFTQFQLEVNNQYSEVFKDVPRGYREKGVAALIAVLLKYFIGAWIFNDLYETLIGRRPALDPIGLLNEAAGDYTGYALPNLFEMAGDLMSGKDIDFQTEKKSFGEATKDLAGSVLSELPFSSGLTLLGLEIDGGRIPVSSAIPDVSALWDAATNNEWGDEKRWKEAGDELSKLLYVALPFGGNQISKAAKGIAAAVAGGSYSVDSEGNEILQYPIYNDIGSIIRVAIMGKNATKEAQEWVDSGFASLNAKQTAAYKDMIAAGVDPRDAFELLKNWKSLGTLPGEGTDDQRRRELLLGSDISAEGKKIMVGMMLGTEMETDSGKPSQYAKFLSALDTGMDVDEHLQFRNDGGDVDKYLSLYTYGMTAGEAADYTIALNGLEPLEGKKQVTDSQRRELLLQSDYSDKGKIAAIGEMLGTEMETDSGNPSQYAKFLDALDAGMDVDEYLRFRNDGGDIDNYLKFKVAGLSDEHAMELSVDLEELEPMKGEDRVITVQRLQAAVDSSDDSKEQLTALATMMQESQYKKVAAAYSYGVKPATYVHLMAIRPDFDANGNGSYSQAEIEAAIDALNEGYENPLLALKGEAVTLTIKQKAILWQLLTGAKSAKKNPYSEAYGQLVLDAAGD